MKIYKKEATHHDSGIPIDLPDFELPDGAESMEFCKATYEKLIPTSTKRIYVMNHEAWWRLHGNETENVDYIIVTWPEKPLTPPYKPNGIPTSLPDPPEFDGYHWEPRGWGWTSDELCNCSSSSVGDPEWDNERQAIQLSKTMGMKHRFYIEYIKDEPHPHPEDPDSQLEEPRKSKLRKGTHGLYPTKTPLTASELLRQEAEKMSNIEERTMTESVLQTSYELAAHFLNSLNQRTKQMNTTEQNIAIAESLGITVMVKLPTGEYKGLTKDKKGVTVPSYTTDLNACHEFEKTLDGDNKSLYHDHLSLNAEFTKDRHETAWRANWAACTATAAQRCEAYLRTLGLWKEES